MNIKEPIEYIMMMNVRTVKGWDTRLDTPLLTFDTKRGEIFPYVLGLRGGIIYPQPKMNDCRHLRYNQCCGKKRYDYQSPYSGGHCLLDFFGNCGSLKEIN